MYANGFLPAVYQPTMFRPGDRPVLNLDLPPAVTPEGRRRTLGLLRDLNRASLDPADDEFAADRVLTCSRCSPEAPAVLDIAKESRETLDLYGIGREPTNDYGRRCL